MKYRNIIIEGNIGAGKTTCAISLSQQLNARLVLEKFENNPFLESFYSNRERHGLQVELYFLTERYHQLSQMLSEDFTNKQTIFDYHFSKSAIFGEVNLRGDEQILFQNLYHIMNPLLPKPDIVIYIHLPVEQVITQIGRRGRKYERLIPTEYLRAIQSSYFSSFEKVVSYPVVVVDINNVNEITTEKVLSAVNEILSNPRPNGLSFSHH